jgi:thiamine biosynthesis lipoprotein
MPLLETLPVGPAIAQWPVWSTTARLVVTDPARLPAARVIAEDHLAAVDLACSRFRSDSELALLRPGRPTPVSPLLANLMRKALGAAAFTGGLVTPTLGGALSRLGYDRDWVNMEDARSVRPLRTGPAPSFRQVSLEGQVLTVPRGVQLDLGATGKAFTADLVAADVAKELAVGVLVALGGDIATAGEPPADGWHVLVQDRPDDPAVTVALPPGAAIATSSTQGRRWNAGGPALHHVLDPRSCTPCMPVWRTASVTADSCVRANALSTAALILGDAAPAWLLPHGEAARLISAAGEVVCVSGFPEQAQP